MNVSAIFPSGTLSQPIVLQNANQQRQTEFQQLTQALQAGNLTNAQQAFGALTKSTINSGIQSIPLTQDLNALGSALQSGDLAGARDAYAAVQQAAANSTSIAAHHHRQHHGGGGPRVLTSGFPGGAPNSGSAQDVFQSVNLTA